MRPALEGEDSPGRPYVYAEQSGDGNFTTSQFMTMVRDSRWKLVHFLDEPWGQLFDLENDPEDRINLWDRDDAKTVKDRLLSELREWNIRSQFQTSSWPSHWR